VDEAVSLAKRTDAMIDDERGVSDGPAQNVRLAIMSSASHAIPTDRAFEAEVTSVETIRTTQPPT
jgi:hypothetical protein